MPPELRTMAFNEMSFMCDKNLKFKIVENLYFVTFFLEMRQYLLVFMLHLSVKKKCLI